jgi:hypothetical protein
MAKDGRIDENLQVAVDLLNAPGDSLIHVLGEISVGQADALVTMGNVKTDPVPEVINGA